MAGNNSYNLTTFNYDTACFFWGDADCMVTPGMVSFLNITTQPGEPIASFLQAYCSNPPPGDDCDFGFCPNPDVAGPLVRVGSYLSNILLAIQIFYQPNAIRDAFQAQMLTVFGLLFATSVSLAKGQLSKLHAVTSSLMIASPVTIYLWVYTIFSVFCMANRLSETLGPTASGTHKNGHRIACLLVLTSLIVWSTTIFFVYTLDDDRFSQPSCNIYSGWVITSFYADVIVGLVMMIHEYKIFNDVLAVEVLFPIMLATAAWMVAVALQWRVIWGSGHLFKPMKIWRTVGDQYPFVYFAVVIFVPTYWWILSVELPIFMMGRDDLSWGVSFGQILSVFIAVQPMLSVLPLVPKRLIPWFANLTWVRAICSCLRWGMGKPRVQRQAQGRGYYKRTATGHARGITGSGFVRFTPDETADEVSLRKVAILA